MAKKWVCCLAEDATQACRIIERLLRAGFSSTDISVLLPDSGGRRWFPSEKAASRGGSASPPGVVVGAALGMVTGLSAGFIRGLGHFAAAGPIMDILSGMTTVGAAGGVAGGLLGMLIELGLAEKEGEKYERGLLEGQILLAVGSKNSAEVRRAQGVFERQGAHDISSSCAKYLRKQPAPQKVG